MLYGVLVLRESGPEGAWWQVPCVISDCVRFLFYLQQWEFDLYLSISCGVLLSFLPCFAQLSHGTQIANT